MYTPYQQLTVQDVKELDSKLSALSLVMESQGHSDLLNCMGKIRQWLNGTESQQIDVDI